MGSGQSTTINIYYSNGRIYRESTTGSSTSVNSVPLTEVSRLSFSESEWEEIKKKKELEIDYCLLDNNLNGIEECIGLFKKTNNIREYVEELNQFRVVKSNTSCNSLYFRPGSVIQDKDLNAMREKITNEIVPGKKCKIIFQDYNYNDNDMKRCCYYKDEKKCNANLINNYTTNHCNAVMLKECDKTPDNVNCITWLEQTFKRKNNLALELYNKKCKKDHTNLYCDYLCKVARSNKDYRSEYCDTSLKTWCKNNPNYSKCNCLLTPPDIIPQLEEYVGPKVCWLTACASEPNSKWLTTEQIDTRQQCSLTSCLIDIKNLKLNNNASVSLVNDCVSGSKITSTELYALNNTEDEIVKNNYSGVLFSPELFIIFFSFIILFTFLLK